MVERIRIRLGERIVTNEVDENFHLSGFFEVAGRRNGDHAEDVPTRPINPYGVTKLAFEERMRERDERLRRAAAEVEEVAAGIRAQGGSAAPLLLDVTDRAAVREGTRDGTLDVIATDHAPHHYDEKEQAFEDAPFGIVGLETALGLAISELVDTGVLTLPGLVLTLVTGVGLLIASLTALAPVVVGDAVLESVVADWHLPALGEVHATSATVFDIGVYLVVVGLMLMVFEAFGDDPRTDDADEADDREWSNE
jgi:hypothetical protein